MSEIETSLLSIDRLGDAAAIIAAGGVVAFPTETVYGLGADATNAAAILRIFEAKGRPSDNPLIVHVADVEGVFRVAKEVSPIAQKLIHAFWPGPLTIVMPKGEWVSEVLCAGLPSVAVRMPKHSVAIELIRRAGVPLVAPSANRSGRPSGTTWEAVQDDLSGRIDGIVCGEPIPTMRSPARSDFVDGTPSCLSRRCFPRRSKGCRTSSIAQISRDTASSLSTTCPSDGGGIEDGGDGEHTFCGVGEQPLVAGMDRSFVPQPRVGLAYYSGL